MNLLGIEMDKLFQKLFFRQRIFSILNANAKKSDQSSTSTLIQNTQRAFLSYSSQTLSKGPEITTTVEPQDLASNLPEVQVSESCAKRLTELSDSTGPKFLRVSVEGGGCSGFQYKFEIDSNLQPDDRTFAHPTFKSALVVVDSTSLEYLKGAMVDYHVELIRSAFRVVQNPKAEHGCSCGASFTVKID